MARKQKENYILKNEPYLLEPFFKTIVHFFPKFDKWIDNIKDPRNILRIIYPKEFMLWIGILMFSCKLSSRRQIKFQFNTQNFLYNLNNCSQIELQLDTIPHPDTINYFYSKLDTKYLERFNNKMLQRLIRSKSLEKFRLEGYYLIVIDGTGHLTFRERHCEHCLSYTYENGKTIYYHKIVAAKLVTDTGMAFSLVTEFIENTKEDQEIQDCELAACYRLLERLKNIYPQLKICLLMDSLYANQTIFKIAEKNKWKYIINFKEGSIPYIAQEAYALSLLLPENNKTIIKKEDNIIQKFNWVWDINYENYLINYIKCVEKSIDKVTTFEWITNFQVNQQNVDILANKGGRQRWKIENQGFNMQKNSGYNLEHAYSIDYCGMKNFYLLMQIAHNINLLVEHGNLFENIIKTFGSIKNIASRLLEELKNYKFDFPKFEYCYSFYIKLDSS